MAGKARRKRVQHAPVTSRLRFLTFSCYQRRPLLDDPRTKPLLATSLTRACPKHNFELVAFVFMPEHVHLIVRPMSVSASVSALLSGVKRPMSVRYKGILENERSPLLDSLTVRERPGRFVFRFWQEGSGHDRTLTDTAAIVAALKYVHRNPVTRMLCRCPEAWEWSSFRQYAGLEVGTDVPLVVKWMSGRAGAVSESRSTG